MACPAGEPQQAGSSLCSARLADQLSIIAAPWTDAAAGSITRVTVPFDVLRMQFSAIVTRKRRHRTPPRDWRSLSPQSM